ncbi:hypothetical protein EXU85_18245 [Spirosoma sp. KCTC 42546]|uniref:hypothetical protein n=1 Tax=Spirosoma sp. KCTC 42546 TaxID=2520506 RepID=UPI001158CE96|nr:hypothetical protein [Spirosoma sp. KCTC 42546]QDK80440.1 hypothetical protein EXU85_18245 [Spirosoma sp. KCTC 42546]
MAQGRPMALKGIENSIKRALKQVANLVRAKKIKQKSRSENRGGFPLLSTPFQDRRPGGRRILMFNLPFVKDCYAKLRNFFHTAQKSNFYLGWSILQMLKFISLKTKIIG